MDPIRLKELITATSGQLFFSADSAMRKEAMNYVLLGTSTDSRTIKRGEAFFALKGENFDGHAFVEQAVRAGAVAVVVSDLKCAELWQAELPTILVEDTLTALQKLAAYYRQNYLHTLVAITGSVGKTSTREMIAAALRPTLAVSCTGENLNNEIGVPQTVLKVRSACDVAVVEMGMDHAGDLTKLSRLAQPDIAVITNIGYCHIEQLGSQMAIMRAKAEIINGLKADGVLLLNADDPFLRQLAAEQKGKIKQAFVALNTCPPDLPGDCLVATDVKIEVDGCASFIIKLQQAPDLEKYGTMEAFVDSNRLPRIKLPVPGEHHVINALFGLATAHLLHQPLTLAAGGLRDFSVIGNRQRIMNADGVVLINDTYNAAPESIRAGVKTLCFLAHSEKRRAIAVLGGIAELGNMADRLHYELGRYLATADLAEIWLCGPYAAAVAQGIADGDQAGDQAESQAGGKGDRSPGASGTEPAVDLASESVALTATNYTSESRARAEATIKPPVKVHVFADRDSLTAELLPTIQDRDIILIKGSHSFAMEKVCDAIISKRLAE